jgi:hypothetical protein
VSDLINRLRCHEQHAVHDYDDDCEEAANEIERLTAEVRDLRSKIDDANMAAAETARDWEQRCYSIMAALGEDYAVLDRE